MKKKVPFLIMFLAAIALTDSARAQSPTLEEEMQQRMQELQLRMQQGLRGFDQFRDSSGIFFHFDTTFSGDTRFFRFTPPGDSLGGLSELEQLLRSMFDFGEPFTDRAPGARPFPKDDGHLPHGDDELLPEERLRQEEQAPPNGQQPPVAPPPPPAKKPRVPSIRI